MPAIMQFAERHDLRVVEDAAPAVGAEVGGHRTGSFGSFAAFSFQGAKILSTGEGGMLVTDDAELMARAQVLGDHGRDPARALWNTEVGYKYKMSNLQAAMGLAQLERIEELVERKRWINARYREALADFPTLRVSGELPGCRSIHWMTSVEIAGLDQVVREDLMKELREAQIDTRPVFYPLSSMPMFEGDPCPVAARVGASAINLPSGHMRTEEEIEYVCEHLVSACRGRGLMD
jgi:perosamine synthetase